MSPSDLSANPVLQPDGLRCDVCGASHKRRTLIPVASLRQSMGDHLSRGRPESWIERARVCRACLGRARQQFQLEQLQNERGRLSEVEREIAEKAAKHSTLAEDLENEFDATTSFGQRIADRVAVIGGSWTFVITFLVLLGAWMAINSIALAKQAFDPFPYILLNLVLSCIAALQAPIIMMSQNRMSQRDRRQADQDFRINLKAEIEIASLHEKVDHLLNAQWERMVEMQQTQIELLDELANRRRTRDPGGRER